MAKQGNGASITKLLILFTVFSSITTFAGIFINVYVWKSNQSLVDVGIYNITFFLFIFIGTIAGIYCLKLFNSNLCFIMATLFMCLTFGTIYLIKNIEWLTPFIGVPLGLSLGLFYIGFNMFALVIPNENKRSYLLSMEEVLGRASAFIVPIFSALIITSIGYESIFSILFVMILSIILISFKTPRYKSDFNFMEIKIVPLWNSYKLVFLSLIAFGFLNGLVGMSSSIFIFSKVSNELFLGALNTLLSLLGIISAYILSRKLRYHRSKSKRYSFLGTILSFVAISLLFFHSIPLLIVFNILITIAIPILWIPINIAQFNEMKRLACVDEYNCNLNLLSGYLLIREFFLTMGRVFFFSMLLVTKFEVKEFSFIVMLGISLFIPLLIFWGNHQLFRAGLTSSR